MRAIETLFSWLIVECLVLILIIFSGSLEVHVSSLDKVGESMGTHIVLGLFVFVSLLVGSGLLLIWLTLFLAEGLPFVTKDLADLTCRNN